MCKTWNMFRENLILFFETLFFSEAQNKKTKSHFKFRFHLGTLLDFCETSYGQRDRVVFYFVICFILLQLNYPLPLFQACERVPYQCVLQKRPDAHGQKNDKEKRRLPCSRTPGKNFEHAPNLMCVVQKCRTDRTNTTHAHPRCG